MYVITGHKGFIGNALWDSTSSPCYGISSDIFQGNWKSNLIRLLEEQEPEVIFHVGGVANTSTNDINHVMERNYEFTKAISEWAFYNNVKLIFSSTASCYGNLGYPINLYGWSKYAAEFYVQSFGGISLRYFNVYGPGEERKSYNHSFIHNVINQEGDIKIFPGSPKRDFVHIEDVVSANMYAFHNYDKLSGNCYDVGFGQAVTYEKILNLFGKPFSYLSKNSIPDNYQYYTCANPEKFMDGWSPKISIEEGLKKLTIR